MTLLKPILGRERGIRRETSPHTLLHFRAHLTFLIVSGWFIITLLAAGPGLAEEPSSQPPLFDSSANFIPGEILVKFQPHVDLLGAQGSIQAEGLQVAEASRRGDLLRIQVPSGQEAEFIADLMARGDVEFATYNRQIRAVGDPNDPDYWLQWGLSQINAPEAWDIHTGNNTVTIAIIDTGVDLEHSDLQANIVPGEAFIDGSTNPDDDNGHGTHVAGIAAATGNNGIGIAGVSWAARIMPLKILDAAGNGNTFDLAQAIYYAADQDAQIINMSLGASCSGGWPEVQQAVDYAVSRGVLLIAAAGNGPASVFCPGALNGVMAIGATTASDQRAYYSNYGADLDLMAPGSYVYSTYREDSYAYMSGTSMAVPHVAGLAALMWSFVPALSSNQVQEILQNNADDLGEAGWDPYYGYGRINAWRTMESLTLQISPSYLTLYIDDESEAVPGSIQVTTINPDGDINWTADVSPPVSWLSLSPPTSGTVSATSGPAQVNLLADRPSPPDEYGIYTTTVVITGTTGSGTIIGPKITEVQLQYLPQVYRHHFPLIFAD